VVSVICLIESSPRLNGVQQLLVPPFSTLSGLSRVFLFQMSRMERAVPRLRRLKGSQDLAQEPPAPPPAAAIAQEALATGGGKKKSAVDAEARRGKKIESAGGVPPAVGEVNPPGGGTPPATGREKEGEVGIGVGPGIEGGAPVPLKATGSPAAGAGPGRTLPGGVGGTGAPPAAQAPTGAAGKGASLTFIDFVSKDHLIKLKSPPVITIMRLQVKIELNFVQNCTQTLCPPAFYDLAL
jgi:hypothetical protein